MDSQPYIEWMVRSTPATLRQWLDDSDLGAELRADFERTWTTRVESQQDLAGYASCCPVEGAQPDDYRLREIPISAGATVLAGIHFKNLLQEHPFVGVYAQTRDLTPREVAEASLRLADEFALFHPRHVRWWSPEQLELRGVPGANGDQRLMVGRLEDITCGPVPDLPQGMSLEADPDVACYDEYREMYAEFFRRNPTWKDKLSMEKKETLEACAKDGALYCLRDAGRIAGVMAARPGVLRGIRGWEIVEEVLGAEYRGRGIAPSMQRQFGSRLDRTRATLIIGQIADENLSSRGTALRAGRKDVGGWVFV